MHDIFDGDKQHDKFHDRHIFTNHKDAFVHVEEMQFKFIRGSNVII